MLQKLEKSKQPQVNEPAVKICVYLKQRAFQLLLPLFCLFQDGFPPLVQILQFALQTGSFLSSTGLHQFITSFVHCFNC